MNAIKKIGFRAFQSVMKILIPVFPYREPKLLDGIDKIALLLKEKNINCILLVTDKGIRSLGLTQPLEKLLSDSGISCIVYDETKPNPTSDNIEEAREIYIQNKCQGSAQHKGCQNVRYGCP